MGQVLGLVVMMSLEPLPSHVRVPGFQSQLLSLFQLPTTARLGREVMAQVVAWYSSNCHGHLRSEPADETALSLSFYFSTNKINHEL